MSQAKKNTHGHGRKKPQDRSDTPGRSIPIHPKSAAIHEPSSKSRTENSGITHTSDDSVHLEHINDLLQRTREILDELNALTIIAQTECLIFEQLRSGVIKLLNAQQDLLDSSRELYSKRKVAALDARLPGRSGSSSRIRNRPELVIAEAKRGHSITDRNVSLNNIDMTRSDYNTYRHSGFGVGKANSENVNYSEMDAYLKNIHYLLERGGMELTIQILNNVNIAFVEMKGFTKSYDGKSVKKTKGEFDQLHRHLTEAKPSIIKPETYSKLTKLSDEAQLLQRSGLNDKDKSVYRYNCIAKVESQMSEVKEIREEYTRSQQESGPVLALFY